MLKKSYSKTKRSCRVTFKLPTEGEEVALLGEFNEWQQDAHPMIKRKDGTFSITISLDSGKDYRFRYLKDGEDWLNDEAPDAYVLNRYGSQDCVVSI